MRVRSLFSSVKHGTELRGFRADTPDATDRWDGDLRLHRRGESTGNTLLRRLGNMCLGEVSESGSEGEGMREGDRVCAHLPIRETHTVAASRLQVEAALASRFYERFGEAGLTELWHCVLALALG